MPHQHHVAAPELEARVLAAVDPDWLTTRLTELVAVPSITGSSAESEAQHLMAGWLAGAGLDVDLWPIDMRAIAADPDFPGTEAPRVEAWGLVGVTHGDRTPGLVLSGHIDVVPPGDPAQWPGDPFVPRIVGGALHGRGACDMKAGLVAALGAARALHDAGIRLAAPLAVHSVVGEEDGGLGALATLRRGHSGAACVIPEPTGGRVVTANAGALGFRLTVMGHAAHGAVRDRGVSALEAFLPVHRALIALETERHRDVDPRFADHPRPYALSIGTVHAGEWSSTVPDRLVAEGRFGVHLGEAPATARHAFETAVAAACAGDPWLAAHPVRVEWTGGQFASGALPVGHPLLAAVQTAVTDVTGVRPLERAAPFGSDLRQYAAAGIPTLHYGPGHFDWAHAPDERVTLAEVVDVTRTFALLAVRLCGPA
ncbi:MAG: ArgE/DapE family deacylase [Geodermatophilaceae bacterium]|nr:ArgE/DapE family deacylase [Geodermatophilaceae bacterium]